MKSKPMDRHQIEIQKGCIGSCADSCQFTRALCVRRRRGSSSRTSREVTLGNLINYESYFQDSFYYPQDVGVRLTVPQPANAGTGIQGPQAAKILYPNSSIGTLIINSHRYRYHPPPQTTDDNFASLAQVCQFFFLHVSYLLNNIFRSYMSLEGTRREAKTETGGYGPK